MEITLVATSSLSRLNQKLTVMTPTMKKVLLNSAIIVGILLIYLTIAYLETITHLNLFGDPKEV